MTYMTPGVLPDDLTHYGVKGMKWGKRKTATSSLPDSNDHTVSRELVKKPLRSMSNSEVQTLGKRLQLEKSYKELTAKPSKFAIGHKKVKAALGVAATASSIYAFANSPLGKAIKSQVGDAQNLARAKMAAQAAAKVSKVGSELVLRR